jgi:lactoylglutathione lyase
VRTAGLYHLSTPSERFRPFSAPAHRRAARGCEDAIVPERARLVGINHVALEVGDVDEALQFYGEIFELTLRGRSPRMAFVDIGDQFVALSAGRSQPADRHRHFGLVVDDRKHALAVARAAGADVRGNRILDPWGNNVEVVDYRDVQFTKADHVLDAMGLNGLEKSPGRSKNCARRASPREARVDRSLTLD